MNQENTFKVKVRRNWLLGLWPAEKLGLPASLREAYAEDVALADLPGQGSRISCGKMCLLSVARAPTKPLMARGGFARHLLARRPAEVWEAASVAQRGDLRRSC